MIMHTLTLDKANAHKQFQFDFYNEVKVGNYKKGLETEDVSRDLAAFRLEWKSLLANDTRIAEFLMTTKWAVQLLQQKDEDAYENTPMHLACALQSYCLLKIYMAKFTPEEKEQTLKLTNKEGMTAKDVLEKEINRVNGCLNEEYKQRQLKTLQKMKQLFD